MSKIPLIHHRGFHNYNRELETAFDPSLVSLAENGLAAFKRAAESEARGMEFDVEYCNGADPDSSFCIFHDEDFSDITGESVLRVEDLTLLELSQLCSRTKNKRFFDDASPLNKVPSFKEAMKSLETYTGTLSIELKVNIEDKRKYVEGFKTQIQYLPKNAEVILHSFNIETMKLLVKACPHAHFGFNFGSRYDGLNELKRIQEDQELFSKISYLYPDFDLVKSVIDLNLSKPLVVWTVNDTEAYKELLVINETKSGSIEAIIADNHLCHPE